MADFIIMFPLISEPFVSLLHAGKPDISQNSGALKQSIWFRQIKYRQENVVLILPTLQTKPVC